MRGAAEDIEIVTLLLSKLALGLDHIEGEVDHMDGEFDHMEGELDHMDGRAFDLGKGGLEPLFRQFGSDLRKLQIGPSGDSKTFSK